MGVRIFSRLLFRWKFRYQTEIPIFDKIFDFWPNFRFLTKFFGVKCILNTIIGHKLDDKIEAAMRKKAPKKKTSAAMKKIEKEKFLSLYNDRFTTMFGEIFEDPNKSSSKKTGRGQPPPGATGPRPPRPSGGRPPSRRPPSRGRRPPSRSRRSSRKR